MLTQGIPRRKVHRLILISSFACLVILVLFMLVGTRILDFFGISVDAFQIAGGLVLGRVGLDEISLLVLLPLSDFASLLRKLDMHHF